MTMNVNTILKIFITVFVILNFKKIIDFLSIKIANYEGFSQEVSEEDNKNIDKKKLRILNPALDIDNKVIKSYPNKIFISIASYRDNECSTTINSIYENAKRPENINIGICQQNDNQDPDCLMNKELYNKYKKQIRIVRIPHTDARGPTYARYICSHLWNGEEYFLQIDSHMKFFKDWDEKIINNYKNIGDDKAIISSYPLSHEQEKNQEELGVPHMCNSKLNGDNVPMFYSEFRKPTEKPTVAPYTAAGLFFTKGKSVLEVPYDPYLPHLFQGEEFLHSARLWTHGWNFYMPQVNICSHHYGRNDKPKSWNDHREWKKYELMAIERLKYILGLIKESDVTDKDYLIATDKYGLGKERTIKEYFEFSGVDFDNKTTNKICGKTYNKNKNIWE